jgi:hypothetical protein
MTTLPSNFQLVQLSEKVSKVESVHASTQKHRNNFTQAQNVFSHNQYLKHINVEDFYSERIKSDFVGTYMVKVERTEDFKEFLEKKFWAYRNTDGARMTNHITFENWRDNTYIDMVETQKGMKERTIKLTKALIKFGYPQDLIEFYNIQIKTEKDIFVTISENAQDIAGMSAHAKKGSWTGYGGTSCQDTRLGGSACKSLVSAINCPELFTIMLHENLEDLKDMQDKLLARTNAFIVTLDHSRIDECIRDRENIDTLDDSIDFLKEMALDQQFIFTVGAYGNSQTKDILRKALKEMNKAKIYNGQISDSELWDYSSNQDIDFGNYSIDTTFKIRVQEERKVRERRTVTCPLCNGNQRIWVEEEHRIQCPLCHGTGEHEIIVRELVDIDQEVDVQFRSVMYEEGGIESDNGNTYIESSNYKAFKWIERTVKGDTEE